MQWNEEGDGYPYYVQPVTAKEELKFVWQVLAGHIRHMFYRVRSKCKPRSAFDGGRPRYTTSPRSTPPDTLPAQESAGRS